MTRIKTENTTLTLYRKSKSDKSNAVGKEISDYAGVHCCQFITSEARAKNEKELITAKLLLKLEELPEENRDLEFINKWLDFVNSFGFDVKLEESTANRYYFVYSNTIVDKGFFYLFILNLLRYLWSTKYDFFPRMILDLRDDPSLSHLDNWEIFQLAHHVRGNSHFHDMSPIAPSNSSTLYMITPIEFLNRRITENTGGHLVTFNIIIPDKDVNKKYRKIKFNENPLEIYNTISSKVNGFSDFSYAKCINDKDFDDEITVNSTYEIVKVFKSMIRLINGNYSDKLYSKKRFTLI